MTNTFFITGTGTNVGKTLITAALCHQLMQRGDKVCALKPVVSGFAYDDPQSDPAVLLQSLGQPVMPETMNAIAPWRFKAPLSPHMAAWEEGDAPCAQQVADFCKTAAAQASILLIEAAGGVMTPLNDQETMLDISVALDWPVILVAGSYLGAINHTLSALQALMAAGVTVHAVVVSESAEGGPPLDDTAHSIRLFAPKNATVYTVPRLPAQENLWKHLPNLTALCS